MATKSSILIFYLRLSKNTIKLLRVASYITLAIVNIAGIILTFLNIFQCQPIDAIFDVSSESNTQCIGLVNLYLASAPVNVITDLAILCLPLPVLTGMRLPQRQKTILVFTFCLGIFVTVVDVVRIYYLQQAALDGSGSISDTGSAPGQEANFAWNASLSLMWSAVEVNVGIVCACIPTLKPLVRRISPHWLDHTNSGTSQSPNAYAHANGANLSPVRATFDQEPPPAHLAPERASEEPTLNIPPSPHQTDGNKDREPPPHTDHSNETGMNLVDFLTTPETAETDLVRMASQGTANTDNSIYFGFVNMKRPKSMLKTRGIESLKYCTAVTILFFLWGFSYGLLNTLNTQIAKITQDTTAQTLGLQTSYWSAYLVAPLTLGQWVLRNGGFKATFITGLCIYAIGTLMFWPSAVLTSFPAFIVSNFVVGFGLAMLETAANPFIALCGPEEYSEYRLLLAQAIQGAGSLISEVLAEDVLFQSVSDQPSLIDVQWTYLAIALFDVILALFFYYMPLPEASNDDLYALANHPTTRRRSSYLTFWEKNTLQQSLSWTFHILLPLAFTAQFLYVAAQESLSLYFSPLLSAISSTTHQPLSLSRESYSLVSKALFAASRFLAAYLCLVVPPSAILLTAFAGSMITAFVTAFAPFASPQGAAVPALLIFFFEGPIFPLVFAIALQGLGRNTKLGAAILVSATSGGGVFPWVMNAVARSKGRGVLGSMAGTGSNATGGGGGGNGSTGKILAMRGTKLAFCVVGALFAAGCVYPCVLSYVECFLGRRGHSCRRNRGGEEGPWGEDVDRIGERDFANVDWRGGAERRAREEEDERTIRLGRRVGQRFSLLLEKVEGKLGRGSIASAGSSEIPDTEHRETRWGSTATAC